ncbi:MAG: DUF1080 domain-containing protein [Lentisphaerales bacterium]|nr:DUF1080 domain-containing protein [Lentisphaerales bacterium]
MKDGKLTLSAKDSFNSYERDKITYACSKEEWLAAMDPNGWNTVKVTCVGKYPVYTTWLNGTKVMVLDSNFYQGRYRKDTSKVMFNKENIHKLQGMEGYIGLQIHPGKRMNGKVHYKNIRIQKL